ncbi:unnamed protein product [Caenorhabditis auriculariae]|uniref:Ground-like domain-containing protein n=1 Tax=Caenorhabditis auriculariae TaxID=2777116 RepID=A0A8S1HME8_9PELO|nr:unnamed protein product [Caenorhabditis auriculariae]
MILIAVVVVCLGNLAFGSPPHMCHCPNGQFGMSCPTPITLNCPPAPACPTPLPCNPFPTLPTITPDPNALRGLSQFSLPTLPPLMSLGGQNSGNGYVFSTPLPGTLPPAVPPPNNGQEALVGIDARQYPQQPAFPQQQSQFQQYSPPSSNQPQQSNLVQVQAAAQYSEFPPTVAPRVDATTRGTTLPSETYVEFENPERFPQNGVYETEPNNGFRQPILSKAFASNTRTQPLNEKCNDDRLRRLIEQNVDSNPSSSKRKIQKAASDEIGGLFDVICSSHDFSYLANTQLFCEAGNDDVTCFAFLHSLIQ